MKKSIIFVMSLLLGSVLFAAENQKSENEKSGESKITMYAKAEVGYYAGGAFLDTDLGGALPSKQKTGFSITGFEITPVFGLMLPVVIQQNFGTLKMAAEAQVPVVIGKSSAVYANGSAFVINPGLMIIENYYFPESTPKGLQKLSGKVGFGFSVPISNVKGSYKIPTAYGYGNTTETTEKEYSTTGAGFKLNFLLGVQYDFTDHISANIDWNLGMFGFWSNSIRAGATWRF